MIHMGFLFKNVTMAQDLITLDVSQKISKQAICEPLGDKNVHSSETKCWYVDKYKFWTTHDGKINNSAFSTSG